MVFSKAEIIAIFKKSKITFSNNAIKPLLEAKIDNSDIAEKMIKAAFYKATKDNRRIVTAQDVIKVLSEAVLTPEDPFISQWGDPHVSQSGDPHK
jgi:AAA+ superfamily predicted ATPase